MSGFLGEQPNTIKGPYEGVTTGAWDGRSMLCGYGDQDPSGTTQEDETSSGEETDGRAGGGPVAKMFADKSSNAKGYLADSDGPDKEPDDDADDAPTAKKMAYDAVDVHMPQMVGQSKQPERSPMHLAGVIDRGGDGGFRATYADAHSAAHPGFAALVARGVPAAALAAASRNASPAAKKANPRLKRVKG